MRSFSLYIIIIITFSKSHRTIVPFILITHDENDPTCQKQSFSTEEISTTSLVDMDNISLKGMSSFLSDIRIALFFQR